MSVPQIQPWRRKTTHRPPRRVADALVHSARAATPQLTMPDVEGNRTALISGSVATLLHVGGLAALLVAATMAPEVVDELTRPITILREAPGSDSPARAGPRALAKRSTPAPAAAARAIAQAAPVNAAPVSAQALSLEELEKAAAPRELDRTQVTSERIQAQRVDAAARAEAIDMAEFQPVTVSPSDLKAPTDDFVAPRQVAPGEQIEISAPQAFQGFVEAGAVEYAEQAASSAQITADTVGVSSQFADVAIGFEVDGGESSGGGGSGEVGGVPGTVPCMESAYVDRYLQIVRARTYARWVVPSGTPVGTKVVLRYELDASGSATRVEAAPTDDPDFGASAVQALRSASPFPAMNDAVRCLEGRRMRAIFTNLADEP